MVGRCSQVRLDWCQVWIFSLVCSEWKVFPDESFPLVAVEETRSEFLAFMFRFVASCVETVSCSDHIFSTRIKLGQTGKMCSISVWTEPCCCTHALWFKAVRVLHKHLVQWSFKGNISFIYLHCFQLSLNWWIKVKVQYEQMRSNDDKTHSLCFSFRSLFSRKSKEPKALSHNATGWRLFGKTAAREGDATKDPDTALSAQQVGSLNTHTHTLWHRGHHPVQGGKISRVRSEAGGVISG